MNKMKLCMGAQKYEDVPTTDAPVDPPTETPTQEPSQSL